MITKAKETGEIISLADDLKAAATDALKKAATLLGVGLHLYNGDSSFHDRPILNHAGKIIWSISSELNDIMLSFVPRLQRTGSN
jgi:hypothetical protein